MKKLFSKSNLLQPLLTFSAASLLLAAHADAADTTASSQGESQEQQVQTTDFEEADANNDGYVDWNELNRAFENQLSAAGLGEEDLLEDFDLNQDEQFDTTEYRAFTTGFTERREYSAAEIDQQREDGTAPSTDQQDRAADQSTQDQSVADQRQSQGDQEEVYDDSGAQQGRKDETAGTAAQDGQDDEAVTAIVSVTAIQQVPIEDIADREVVNLEDEKVGTVEDIVRNGDGTEIGLVVSTGGFFGIGGKEVVIDSEEVHLTEDKVVWENTGENASVDDLPEYNENEYVSVR